MTELEILRRRRELVLMSAQLQRATVVRRLDNVQRHPVQAILGLATSVVSIPLLFKVGMMVFGVVRGRNAKAKRTVRRGRATLVSKALSLLKFLPVLKSFPMLKFLNR